MKHILVYHVSMDTDIDKYDYLSMKSYEDTAGEKLPSYLTESIYKIEYFSQLFELDLELGTFSNLYKFMIKYISCFTKYGELK